MPQLYAQPYNLDATGFYFDSLDMYQTRARQCHDSFGLPVEEFEIMFIDGDDLDCALANAWSLDQASLQHYFNAVENWSDDDKLIYAIAVGECGYAQDSDPSQLDVDIYTGMTLRDLAHMFVDEGLFRAIPENVECYLDYDRIARDLSVDYTETTIAGQRIVYRCA